MELDEETLEVLSYGSQKAYELLAAVLRETQEYKNASRKERYALDHEFRQRVLDSVKRWRKNNPEKYRESRRISSKNYRNTINGRAVLNKGSKKSYNKIKSDPIKWKAYLKRKAEYKKKRRQAQRATKTNNTTTNEKSIKQP